ncbi:hypothetical protein EWF20_06095 [Sulfolobus sp. S-194]|uniref:hypothetical protein n=1 Tax=Sulfolobus sp. S-194 TaxID=2512240 RepID=UPI001436ED34|nr:hypothetical protein [Sulfolobus sp. S-194]QIW23769.1 hypothetical protein EWF20_06095 [Sulfolobus sp. S-194]
MSQQITIKNIFTMLKAVGILMFVMLLVPLESSIMGGILAGHAVAAYYLVPNALNGNVEGVTSSGAYILFYFYNLYNLVTTNPAAMAAISGGDPFEFFVFLGLADPFTAIVFGFGLIAA